MNREVWLVYEINDLYYADVPFCSEMDMKVFETKEEAVAEMQTRKQKYITEDNDWNLSDETEDRITFDDDLKEGSFDICLIQLG